MRKTLPVVITFVVGIIVMLSTITTGPLLGVFKNHISPWMTIVSAFAVGLACVNLSRVHGRKIARKSKGWINSVILLGSMAIYGGWRSYIEINPTDKIAVANYALIYNNILSPLSSGIWACLAFYVASSSYRAFRVRNFEATIMLISAVVVMLGAAPIGAQIWDKFPVIQDWLLSVPNMTGQRGIFIGAALGSFVTALRVLLGLERGYLGSSQ